MVKIRPYTQVISKKKHEWGELGRRFEHEGSLASYKQGQSHLSSAVSYLYHCNAQLAKTCNFKEWKVYKTKTIYLEYIFCLFSMNKIIVRSIRDL